MKIKPKLWVFMEDLFIEKTGMEFPHIFLLVMHPSCLFLTTCVSSTYAFSWTTFPAENCRISDVCLFFFVAVLLGGVKNGRGLVCTRGQGPHLYTRTRASSVHAEWVCCMYQFVLIVVYFVCSMCAGCLVQVFSSCIKGMCVYSWECMQVQGMLPSPPHPPTPTQRYVCVCVCQTLYLRECSFR